MEKVYIVAAKRTAIGKIGGSLATLTAAKLGGYAIKAALKQANIDPNMVDQVLMGNVLQAGSGQNPARQAAFSGGIPQTVPAITINDVCGSGLSSINLGASLIGSGQTDLIVAGGMESMSNAPYVIKEGRYGYGLGHGELTDTVLSDALTDAYGHYHMGITAENLAEQYHISRESMDNFSLKSHQKAIAAKMKRQFDREIVPIQIEKKQGTTLVDQDESPRADTSLEKLAKLKPAFQEEGLVTAGNASGINDGAAVVILASEKALREYQLEPLVQWEAATLIGLEPELMGLGPYYAINKLLDQQHLTLADIDLFELNEAFAAQALACIQELKLDEQLVNIKGGAIALGHPVGASGARILVSLLYSLLEEKDQIRGIASLCVGGGMGVATLIKKIGHTLV